MTNETLPSAEALQQIGNILYGLKAHPQFQTDITNAVMEMHITEPARLLALIEERLGVVPTHTGATNPSPQVDSAPFRAALASANIGQASSATQPTGAFMGSASMGGFDEYIPQSDLPDARPRSEEHFR